MRPRFLANRAIIKDVPPRSVKIGVGVQRQKRGRFLSASVESSNKGMKAVGSKYIDKTHDNDKRHREECSDDP
jgi:hypothetical protein